MYLKVKDTTYRNLIKMKKTLSDSEKRSKKTRLSLKKPKQGDYFSEMYSFWVYILDVKGDGQILTMESSGDPGEPNYKGWYFCSYSNSEELMKRFEYSTVENEYTISYVGRKNKEDIEGYLKYFNDRGSQVSMKDRAKNKLKKEISSLKKTRDQLLKDRFKDVIKTLQEKEDELESLCHE